MRNNTKLHFTMNRVRTGSSYIFLVRRWFSRKSSENLTSFLALSLHSTYRGNAKDSFLGEGFSAGEYPDRRT